MRRWFNRHRPDVSVVVVVHNMAREAPRTLHSLSAAYQRHIAADNYEVIVVDNGSVPPLDAKILDGLAGNFRLIRLDPAPSSPAHAINVGLAEARGDVIGVMIDGARMVTPGLLHFARAGVRLYPCAVVVTLGWYLGLDQQRWSMEAGYNQEREDRLLDSIDWRENGYRLFDIAAFDESSIDGWFGAIAESNGLFLNRGSWDQMSGVDERFDAAGGGLLNIDTFLRAVELPDSQLVILLGEATFHQFHGGIATNANHRTFPQTGSIWSEQYKTIRGRPWAAPTLRNRTYVGTLPPAVLPHVARALIEPVRDAPLGASFDRALWSPTPWPRPSDATADALLALAEDEFRARRFVAAAAVARMARARAPDEPGPQRLLAKTGPWLRGPGVPPDDQKPSFHLARAKAYRLLGDLQTAKVEYCKALTFDTDLVEAHIGLSELRMPGDKYLTWLSRLHAALKPSTYLEIGIFQGHSLCLAQPPTRAVGIDPNLQIRVPLKAETHIFCETSDEFFAQDRLTPLLDGQPLSLAFIDGLHLFEQALKDFINVERHCGPQSVILMHDTFPLDEATQRRNRSTKFYSGDIWRTALCLKRYRPDFDIFTIATPLTGLTVVTGLDGSSRVLGKHYDEAVKQFMEVPYSEAADRLDRELDLVPNDWAVVEARLRARNVL
jgi:Glycosyl transferase family 2/Methyltransferase domain